MGEAERLISNLFSFFYGAVIDKLADRAKTILKEYYDLVKMLFEAAFLIAPKCGVAAAIGYTIMVAGLLAGLFGAITLTFGFVAEVTAGNAIAAGYAVTMVLDYGLKKIDQVRNDFINNCHSPNGG
jgi:hypothetical protein